MEWDIVGFSVIELLISVGVIAVLCALLLPILGSMRKGTDLTRCTNNLRQIGTAFHACASDNRGVLIFHQYSNKLSPTTTRWNDYLVARGYLERTSDLQVCPSAAPRKYDGQGYAYGGIGKADPNDPHSTTLDAAPSFSRAIRLMTIEQPGSYWLLADSWSPQYQRQIYNIDMTVSTYGMHLRHQGRVNMLFADGHVATQSSQEIQKLPFYPMSWWISEDLKTVVQ